MAGANGRKAVGVPSLLGQNAAGFGMLRSAGIAPGDVVDVDEKLVLSVVSGSDLSERLMARFSCRKSWTLRLLLSLLLLGPWVGSFSSFSRSYLENYPQI